MLALDFLCSGENENTTVFYPKCKLYRTVVPKAQVYNKGETDLGPFYSVWQNFHSAQIDSHRIGTHTRMCTHTNTHVQREIESSFKWPEKLTRMTSC